MWLQRILRIYVNCKFIEEECTNLEEKCTYTAAVSIKRGNVCCTIRSYSDGSRHVPSCASEGMLTIPRRMHKWRMLQLFLSSWGTASSHLLELPFTFQLASQIHTYAMKLSLRCWISVIMRTQHQVPQERIRDGIKANWREFATWLLAFPANKELAFINKSNFRLWIQRNCGRCPSKRPCFQTG